MAVTAVYVRIAPAGEGGRASDYHVESNISSTTVAFHLRRDRYAILAVGATFGTLTLQALGPDGSTYLTAATALTASGTAIVDLPDGDYRWALA